MARPLTCAAVAAFLSLAATFAAAQAPPPGSIDTWVEACHATDVDLQALLANDALIVPIEGIESHHDGTFSLVHQPFTQAIESGFPVDLCPSARFYGQAQVKDKPFRSAVQVGPDLVLTAWHSPFNPHHTGAYVVVTGLHATDVGGLCVPPAFEHIPSDRLFEITEVVADGGPTTSGGVDFLLLRVDRAIDGTYPRVRRSGRGWPQDSVTVVGHPERLATKVDTAGVAGGLVLLSGRESLEVANVHVLDSSSGAPLYNRTQRMLETSVNTGGNAYLDPSGQADPDCRLITHHDRWSTVGASLRYFASHIPAFELLVDSLDPVVNATVVGGGLPHPATSRSVQAPATAGGSIAYEIVLPQPFEPGQPTLIISPGAPAAGTLAPGTGFTIQEQTNIHGVSCGRYERSYRVRDLTHGFEDVARHLFEIGLREFTVSSPPVRSIKDLAKPVEDTIVYHVGNPRGDAVDVVVTSDQPWLTLDTGKGPQASLELHLEPGDDVTVTAGVADSIEQQQYPEQFEAAIRFDFAAGTVCPAFTEPVTRRFAFTLGTETFAGSGGTIPNAPFGLHRTIDVPETFCVGDLNVRFDSRDVPANQVVATLTAPSLGGPPADIILWNHEPVSPSAPKAPLSHQLDDMPAPPGSGTLVPFEPLATFNGLSGHGVWGLDVSDVAFPDPGSLDGWELEFIAAPCTP